MPEFPVLRAIAGVGSTIIALALISVGEIPAAAAIGAGIVALFVGEANGRRKAA